MLPFRPITNAFPAGVPPSTVCEKGTLGKGAGAQALLAYTPPPPLDCVWFFSNRARCCISQRTSSNPCGQNTQVSCAATVHVLSFKCRQSEKARKVSNNHLNPLGRFWKNRLYHDACNSKGQIMARHLISISIHMQKSSLISISFSLFLIFALY